jgi:hypothetical protein
MREPNDGSRDQFSAKPDGRGGWFGVNSARATAGTFPAEPPTGRNNMHPEELMKPDLVSEIVLLIFGTLVLSSLALFVVAGLARS